jgi:hypothetical protein
MRGRSIFGLDIPSSRYLPREFREAIGVRSERTIDNYRKRIPGFPQGQLERRGLVEVRTWSPAEVFQAQAVLASQGLPGPRARQRKIANLQKARTAIDELDEIETLAGRVVRVAGIGPLVEALRLLDGAPLSRIEPGHRIPIRAALVAALQTFNR